jgi:hypothetical protein
MSQELYIAVSNDAWSAVIEKPSPSRVLFARSCTVGFGVMLESLEQTLSNFEGERLIVHLDSFEAYNFLIEAFEPPPEHRLAFIGLIDLVKRLGIQIIYKRNSVIRMHPYLRLAKSMLETAQLPNNGLVIELSFNEVQTLVKRYG